MSAGWPRASRWLLTGGAGYIGSHIVRELRAQGCQVVVLDDLSTGVAARIPSNVPLVVADVRDQETVGRVLRRHAVEGVIHLAARKSVAESLVDPLAYWHINVEGTRSVMQAAVESGVRVVIFSSSSSVYGEAGTPTVAEDCPLVPINPYGQTKVAGEQLVAAAARAAGMSWVALRYFNVAGAAEPALVDTCTTTLVPTVLGRLARGEAPVINGLDHPTADGSCIRDFVHVQDVARAHVRAALVALEQEIGQALNIGTGVGVSVREVVDLARGITGVDVPVRVAPARTGDPAHVVADVASAWSVLNWRSEHSVADMVTSAWTGMTGRAPGEN